MDESGKITARDLLQANATVIAGILIMLGFFSQRPDVNSDQLRNAINFFSTSLAFLIASIIILLKEPLYINKLPQDNVKHSNVVKIDDWFAEKVKDLSIAKICFGTGLLAFFITTSSILNILLRRPPQLTAEVTEYIGYGVIISVSILLFLVFIIPYIARRVKHS